MDIFGIIVAMWDVFKNADSTTFSWFVQLCPSVSEGESLSEVGLMGQKWIFWPKMLIYFRHVIHALFFSFFAEFLEVSPNYCAKIYIFRHIVNAFFPVKKMAFKFCPVFLFWGKIAHLLFPWPEYSPLDWNAELSAFRVRFLHVWV